MQASIRNHRGTPALKTITAIIAIHRPHHHHYCRRHLQDHNHLRRRNQHHRHEQDHHRPQNQVFFCLHISQKWNGWSSNKYFCTHDGGDH